MKSGRNRVIVAAYGRIGYQLQPQLIEGHGLWVGDSGGKRRMQRPRHTVGADYFHFDSIRLYITARCA